MITITQKCDSCGVERILTVPGFGSADVAGTVQMQRVDDALASADWQPLGTELWLDPTCVETKLGISLTETPPSGGDVPISYE